MYQNNEMAAILVYGTGISSFLFKYFVLFHHPTGATDHVSENDLYRTLLLYTVPYSLCCKQGNAAYIAVELYGQATERHNLSELAERIPVVHPGNINTYSYLKIIIY